MICISIICQEDTSCGCYTYVLVLQPLDCSEMWQMSEDGRTRRQQQLEVSIGVYANEAAIF